MAGQEKQNKKTMKQELQPKYKSPEQEQADKKLATWYRDLKYRCK